MRPPASEDSPEPELPPGDLFQTKPNNFGLFRVYSSIPSHDPDEELSLNLACDAPGLAVGENDSGSWRPGFGSSGNIADNTEEKFFLPFLNATVFRLMNWFYGTNIKSFADLERLVREVILANDFNADDLQDFNEVSKLRRLNNYSNDPGLSAKDGWKQIPIDLPAPADNVQQTEAIVPVFEVPRVWY